MFADEEEAADFARIVKQKSEILCISRRDSTNNTATPYCNSNSREGSIRSIEKEGSNTGGGGFFSSIFRRRDKDKERDTNEKHDGKHRGKERKKNEITVDDISEPTDFRHLAHIGFNSETGAFDIQNIPNEWKAIFEKAGVTQDQLQDRKTAGFIADFVDKKTAALDRQRPPPPVKKKGPAPPPPSKNFKPQPPSQPTTKYDNGTRPATTKFVPRSAPEPNDGTFEDSESTPAMAADPAREQLLASIREANHAKLRPVERTSSTGSLNSQSPSIIADDQSDVMAGMLAKALAARNKKLAHSDSSDNDSNW